MIFKLLISTAVIHFANGITLSCVPGVPEYQSNMTCTCTNPTKNGIEWRRNSQIVTTCSGTVDNTCFPSSLEYTSSVSSDEFYIGVSPYSYTDCATYSCKDPITGEEVSATTSIADFDQSSITTEEPGANTDGQIMVNTGCVFPSSDITVTWYKIENGEEEDFTSSRPSPIQSSDRSDCSRTCNTVTEKKVESGFTHTEYTGSDYVEVAYKVTVTHKLYIDEVYTWTSSKYRLIAGSGCPKYCKNLVIASIVFGSLGILCTAPVAAFALTIFINRVKEDNSEIWDCFLGYGITLIVSSIISLGLSARVLDYDNCHDCEDWIVAAAKAFVVISAVLAFIAGVIIFILCFRGDQAPQEGGNDSKRYVGGNNGQLSDRANSVGGVTRRDVVVDVQ